MCNCGGGAKIVRSRNAPQKLKNFQLPLKSTPAKGKAKAVPKKPVVVEQPKISGGSMTAAAQMIKSRNVRPKNVILK